MIIVDSYLDKIESEGRPIRVGLVGAGFAGRGFALQLLTHPVGMRLVAIANRTLSFAEQAYRDAGTPSVHEVKTGTELSRAVQSGIPVITTDPTLLTDSDHIDVIVETTGEVEFGAGVILRAIEHKKDVVLLNAELDGTLGPILKAYADRAGVVYTQADGDQPAVMMNLYRYVQSIGFKPVMAGNIKSLLDHRRTPETQKKWADEHFQRPTTPTAAADGTKISFENATVANATGFRVGKRGMYGPRCASVNDAPKLFPMEQLMNGGLVDYILGAEPSFGVFVLGYSDHSIKQRYMQVYKMGDGPLYTFYTPYHLSPLETPLTVARVAGFRDAALTPKGGLVCEVITIAKRDLKKGETLDGIGGFTCYGTMENADVAARERLLPMGLSEGCVLKRDLPMDAAVAYDDVILPSGRLADKLRAEQDKQFPQVL